MFCFVIVLLAWIIRISKSPMVPPHFHVRRCMIRKQTPFHGLETGLVLQCNFLYKPIHVMYTVRQVSAIQPKKVVIGNVILLWTCQLNQNSQLDRGFFFSVKKQKNQEPKTESRTFSLIIGNNDQLDCLLPCPRVHITSCSLKTRLICS